MTASRHLDIAALDDMTVNELRNFYHREFGEPTQSRHRRWLIKRIAFRLQERAEGGLSQRALDKARELAKDLPFRQARPAAGSSTDNRTKAVHLPPSSRNNLAPGMVLRRVYKGRVILAEVCVQGFVHEGTHYKSLSGLARAVTGTRWNGYRFFGLKKEEGDQ